MAPAAKLAELLVLQGRLKEAARAQADDDSDDTLLVRTRLALARHDAASAIPVAERHRRRPGGDMLLRPRRSPFGRGPPERRRP